MENNKSGKMKAVGAGILGLAVGGIIGWIANELTNECDKKP